VPSDLNVPLAGDASTPQRHISFASS